MPQAAALCACIALVSVSAAAAAVSSGDPPVLVPWRKIGDIALGQSRASVEREYGSFHVLQRYADDVQGYFLLHHSRVIVTFYGDRVGELDFSTRYYRTKSGFGVGSTIPLGPCYRSATNLCEHRWHGFVWNAWVRHKPCNCWVKVGVRRGSLPATAANFLKPWFFLYVTRGRVSELYFASRFVD